MGTIHKTVSECGQNSILCTNKRWWKVQNERRSVFQWKRGLFSERVWLRQKALEPKKEDRSRFDRRRRLPISAIAIENKKSIANSSSRFHRTCAKNCQNLQFSKENRIYATPDEFFVTKFRDIFQQTRLTHTASAEAKTWLRGPNMRYWPQQLNFSVFCATQGCGISREIFDSGLSLQIRAFYQFHVFHSKASFVPTWRHPEHECFAGGLYF